MNTQTAFGLCQLQVTSEAGVILTCSQDVFGWVAEGILSWINLGLRLLFPLPTESNWCCPLAPGDGSTQPTRLTGEVADEDRLARSTAQLECSAREAARLVQQVQVVRTQHLIVRQVE